MLERNNHNVYALAIIVYLSVIAAATTLYAHQIPNAEPVADATYTLTEAHWALFRWYFERVPYVALTPLQSEQLSDLDRLYTEIYTELSKEHNANFKVFSYVYCAHHIKTTQECTHEHTLTEPINEILNNIPRIWRESQRHDEPVFGAVVYFTSLASLEMSMAHLDVGEHPLTSPSGHYIFVMNDIMPFSSCSRQTVARILQKIYDKHHIVQAIFVARINGDAKHQIGYYDPFYRWPTNARGIMKWAALQNIEVNEHSNWILNRGNSLDWHPFRIAMFRRRPTMVPLSELSPIFQQSYFPNVAKFAANYSGFDGIVLGNLAKHLRFRVVPVLNDDAKYGAKLPNQTITGVAGDIINDRADAAFNARFITDYGINELDFLYPVSSDKYCIIAPAAQPLPKYTTTFRCFRKNVWILLLCTQIAIAFVWGALRDFDEHGSNEGRHQCPKFGDSMKSASVRFIHYEFNVYQMLLSHPIRLPKLWPERLFIAACLITYLFVDGIFRSSLTVALRSTIYGNQINTLQELYDSGMPIISSSSIVQHVFDNENGTDLLQALEDRREIRENASPIDIAAYKRDACAIERYSDINILMEFFYKRSDGSAMLHVIPQCPRNYHLAYIIKKGWPLKTKFLRVLEQFNEGGFLKVWNENVEYSFILSGRKQLPYLRNMTITYDDLLIFFHIWFLGIMSAVFVFFVEICLYRIRYY